MPTKKKRVGFIPREDVMKIIDKLSIENNLSNSKIISILVEEALSMRGVFSYKTGIINQSYQDFKDDLSDNSPDLNTNSKFKMNTKILNHNNPNKKNLANQMNQNDFDLQTYEKFLSFLKFKEMLDEFNK